MCQASGQIEGKNKIKMRDAYKDVKRKVWFYNFDGSAIKVF